MDATDSHIRKALATLSIERALLEIGKPVFDEVSHALYNDYECFIPDCFDHPEYLRKVLKDLFGSAHSNIVQSIHENLREFATQQPIQEFLKAINE